MGSFTNANITVNAKGLITAASNGSASSFTAPQVVQYTSGSGTYSVPMGTLYLRVTMSGGGGGGCGTIGDGTSGGVSTFGTSLLVANGGAPGLQSSPTTVPVGGSVSYGAAIPIVAVTGGSGQASNGNAGANGGYGGSNPLGGAGSGGGPGAGGNSATSPGGGGGGAGYSLGSNPGVGGAAGGYLDVIISGSTLSGLGGSALYSVGGAGGGGTGGGGAAGPGIITVVAYFQ